MADVVDRTFPTPVSRAGGPATRRRSVAQRQAAAQRLLFEAAEETYDGDLDVNWEAEPVAGAHWMPPHLTSLYGTRTWRKMSPQQRLDLERDEFCNILAMAMYLNTAASMLTFRGVMEHRELVDDRSRFLLSVVNDRSRNVTMFSRLINRAGVTPHLPRRFGERLATYTLSLPNGSLVAVFSLLADEIVNSLAGEIARSDVEIQPHVSHLFALGAPTRARHIEFGRAELEDSIVASSRTGSAVQWLASAVLVTAVGRLLTNREIYRDVGLGPRRALRAARRTGQYQRRIQSLVGPMVIDAIRVGGFAGAGSRRILKRGRCLPDSVAEIR